MSRGTSQVGHVLRTDPSGAACAYWSSRTAAATPRSFQPQMLLFATAARPVAQPRVRGILACCSTEALTPTVRQAE